MSQIAGWLREKWGK
jgi:hypothetical protein